MNWIAVCLLVDFIEQTVFIHKNTKTTRKTKQFYLEREDGEKKIKKE